MFFHKKMRKLGACLLAVTLAAGLAACSQTGETETDGTAGSTETAESGGVSYVETRITPEELSAANVNYTQIFCAEDGTLEVLGYTENDTYDQTEAFRYRSADGGDSWEKIETPSEWEGCLLENVFVDNEGGLYALLQKEAGEDNESNPVTGYYLPADGTAVTCTLPSLSGVRFGEHAMLFSEENENGEYALEAIDLRTGKEMFTVMEHSSEYISVRAVTAEKIYVFDETDQIAVLSAEDGSQLTTPSDLPDAFASREILQASGKSYYYTDDDNSVCRGVWGADAGEVILDGKEYRYAMEAGDISSVTAFAVDDIDSIYLATAGYGTAGALWRFRIGSENTEGESQTLTVWTLEDSETLREAVLAFEDSHSGWTVDLEIQLTDTDDDGNAIPSGGKTEEDVIKTLNAELLAGAGPDVLILDGLDATASDYCLGKTTLDEAVENLKNELALALAEQ